MGKTKIKILDDSQIEPEKTVKKPEKRDELVEKLKQELGIKEKETIDDRKLKIDVEDGKSKMEKKVLLSSKKQRSKKYLETSKNLDKSKFYPLSEALDMVKKISYSKFNGTLEAHINTMQMGLRGFLQLPYASGKKLRILVFGKGAKDSGADIFGDDETIDEISNGRINFDVLITTPDWMPKLVKLAKILGPKSLMPNPKNGTIASGEDGIKKAVESFQQGKTEYKTEAKTPIIHIALGKLSQPMEELEANVKILLQTIGKTKIKKVVLSPTIGAGVKLDLTSI